MPDLRGPELLDAFFDALSQDPEVTAPRGLAAQEADVARAIVALEHAAPEPGPETAARIWTRVLDGAAETNGQAPTNPRTALPVRGRVRRLAHTAWVARAAAIVFIMLIGGAALSLSPGAQAQVRYLACLVPGLGVRACDSQSLVTMQAVSATSNGLLAEVLGLQASSEGTLVRMRLSGLPVPSGADMGQDQRFEDALPLVEQVQALQVQLRDSRALMVTPVAPGGQAWPGTSPGGLRSARILYYWMESAPDGTWRLAVTAEWAFAPLDANARSVDIAVPAPPGPLAVTIPLVPVQSAGLPVLGAEGAEVAEHGVALRVAGITGSSSGLTLQVAARGATPAERVVGLGKNEPGQPGPVWGRILWDSQGRQHADASTGPADGRSEGDSYLQTLAFAPPSAGAHATVLEVPSVFLLEDTVAASVTIPIDGRQVGDHIALDTKLALGSYPLQVHDATVQATIPGRELVVDLDQGDVQDGRALLGSRTVQVSGRDDLHPRLTGSDPTGQYRQLHVPLPPDIGPQVTLTFSGAFVEVRGPWRLPVPPGPGEQA